MSEIISQAHRDGADLFTEILLRGNINSAADAFMAFSGMATSVSRTIAFHAGAPAGRQFSDKQAEIMDQMAHMLREQAKLIRAQGEKR